MNEYTYYDETNISSFIDDSSIRVKDLLHYLNPNYVINDEISTKEIISVIKKFIINKMFLTEEDILIYREVECIEKELNMVNKKMGKMQHYEVPIFNKFKYEDNNRIFDYDDLIMQEVLIRQSVTKKRTK